MLISVLKNVATKAGQGKEVYDFAESWKKALSQQQIESAQKGAELFLEKYFEENSADLSGLISGQYGGVYFETVLLSVTPDAKTVAVTRYVGPGETLQDSFNLRAAQQPNYFKDRVIDLEAKSIFGSSYDGVERDYRVVDRFATEVRFDQDTQAFSFNNVRDAGSAVAEANALGSGLASSSFGSPLTADRLTKLQVLQMAYERDVADLLAAGDAAKFLEIVAKKEKIAKNTVEAIKAYEEAAEAAALASGLALIGSLLGLAGQVGAMQQSAEAQADMQAKFAAMGSSMTTMQGQIQSLQSELLKLSGELAKFGQKPPTSYQYLMIDVRVNFTPLLVPKAKVGPLG